MKKIEYTKESVRNTFDSIQTQIYWHHIGDDGVCHPLAVDVRNTLLVGVGLSDIVRKALIYEES